jgi:osmotically inducible protein OsmC
MRITEECATKVASMERKASAYWLGSLQTGKGMISTSSGVLSKTPYSFSQRFGNQPGTNPEELIAAAHAGCFAMALSGELGKFKITPDSLDVAATVTLEQKDGQWTLTKVHLSVEANIQNANEQLFQHAVESARKNCPISRALNAEITVENRLQPGIVNPLQETG